MTIPSQPELGAPHLRGRSRGTVLMLMPAALLIVLILGSIAVDFAVVQMRQRELYNIADAAANDACTYGIDLVYLRATGEVLLDPALVERSVGLTLAAHHLDPDGVMIDVENGITVHIEFIRNVPYILGRSLPGADSVDVHVNVRATAHDPTR